MDRRTSEQLSASVDPNGKAAGIGFRQSGKGAWGESGFTDCFPWCQVTHLEVITITGPLHYTA